MRLEDIGDQVMAGEVHIRTSRRIMKRRAKAPWVVKVTRGREPEDIGRADS